MLTQVTLAAIFVMIFLSAWTTEWIGVHAIFGAFLIGLIIPRVGGITMELTHKLEDLVGIAFLPLVKNLIDSHCANSHFLVFCFLRVENTSRSFERLDNSSFLDFSCHRRLCWKNSRLHIGCKIWWRI
jgi:hypothetical protein